LHYNLIKEAGMIYSKKIDNEMNFDVAVLGGGFSGLAAGIAAAIAPEGDLSAVDIDRLKKTIKKHGGITDIEDIF